MIHPYVFLNSVAFSLKNLCLLGLGAGFPVLKKTQRTVKNETSEETPSKVLLILSNSLILSFLLRFACYLQSMSQYHQESETKPEEKSDSPKHEEPQRKPKWMPPRQPG